MTLPSPSELQTLKRRLRAQLRSGSAGRTGQDELSRPIWERLFSLTEYRRAGTVLAYVDMPGEVRTQPYLAAVQGQGKQLVVPYCDGQELRLFFLESLADLSPGTLGILEPKPELRALPTRRADVSVLDLLIVPGMAFDRRGARLGHGKGYFDRLLSRVPPAASLVGLAFEWQVLPELPMLPHDVYMDLVVTELATYPGQGRGSRSA